VINKCLVCFYGLSLFSDNSFLGRVDDSLSGYFVLSTLKKRRTKCII
tara:strand:- start:273 stop:413 length:141 start_codon:yes stop_codon:yes gene_type:complete